MRLFRIFLMVCLALWSTQPAISWAEEPQENNASTFTRPPAPNIEMQQETAPTQNQPEEYGSAFVKMLIALAALFVIVIFVVWLLKSFARGRFSRVSSRHIEIIERRSLSPKSILYLVEVDGARILVAESQLEVRSLYQGIGASEKEND
jgi:flagellar protein FliO/FliZ